MHFIEEPTIDQFNGINIVITIATILGRSSHTYQFYNPDQIQQKNKIFKNLLNW